MIERLIKSQNIFILNLLYGLSPLGMIFKFVVYFLYISLLIYLFGPQTASCMNTDSAVAPYVVSPLSFTVETNTLNSMNDVFYFNLLDFFAGLNKRIPSASKIDLEGCGLLSIKMEFRNVHKLFPIVKLSDLSSIMPNTMGTNDPFSNLTIYATKYPTIQNVQVVGSLVNLMYLQAIKIITDPATSIDEKKDAWEQLINIMPAAVDFQIKNFNFFFSSIAIHIG